MNKRYFGLVMIGVLAALIIGLIMVNRWIQGRVGDIVESPVTAPALPPPRTSGEGKVFPPSKRSGEVIRETRWAPERTHTVNIFFQWGEEIARHKAANGVIYDRTGEIPDGKVKFIDESNETYGVEYYHDGERHGPARSNYKDGRLKQEAFYQYGKLMTSTEYYHDGTVKMEEDYNDARDYQDKREVGNGKVYARDGTLKFEWHLTNGDPIGFHKSYNQRGELTAEIYYDADGAVIPQEKKGYMQSGRTGAGL